MADLTWLRPTAVVAGAIAAPAVAGALHVAGDEYGVALALIAAAAWLDHRHRTWLTRALLAATVAGAALTWPVVAGLTAYLTGVRP